jgi:NAD(P)-dependent dehydrogenase (short-subunit alcohol dehydrogenase family)
MQSSPQWPASSADPVPADFRGKVAIVTGVGRVGQIGHAVARGFGRAGAKLVIVARDAAGLADRVKELTAEGLTVRHVAGDLTMPDTARRAVATAMEQFGGLDVVVNVAGGLVNYGSALDLKPDQLERELAINVHTTFFTCQAALPALVERGGGAIVNFASVAVLKPQSQMASYTAAKAAVAGLTRALAREFRDKRIRVNAVAPGLVRTGDNVAQMKDAKVRWVELDELVGAVLYLASDEATAVTGEVLPVAGDV